MTTKHLTTGRSVVAATALLPTLLLVQVAVAMAATPEAYAPPQIVAQAATATPFRFLTPTPFVPRTTTTTSVTSSSTAPRAGGFPMELALPALAGGLAALGGGTFLLRRKPNS